MIGRTHRNVAFNILVGAGLVVPAFVSTSAYGQLIDLEPPAPNVMILLDTSGSMESMVDGRSPEEAGQGCNPNLDTQPNRWGAAVQALTGDITPAYRCTTLSRATGSAFVDEYQINGRPPYDTDYYLPFHRPLSGNGTCMMGPGTLPGAAAGTGVGTARAGAGGAATDWPSGAIVGKLLAAPATSCTFDQLPNGAIDSLNQFVRFGLMTFDTDTSPAHGTNSGTSVDVGNPFTGTWSYYPNWQTSPVTGATGRPYNCSTASFMEVGARHPAAPPWEGRLIGFPGPTATMLETSANNDKVQQAINAMRPYGATPIAGMMLDARDFFWDDAIGPGTDPYTYGGCRDQYIIMVSDGLPNLDLRPYCEPEGAFPNGQCPFPKADVTAKNLFEGTNGITSGKPKVSTYVVGFAVSDALSGTTPIKCGDMTAAQRTAKCTDPDPAEREKYAPCCILDKIAAEGGTDSARFVESAGALSVALSDILANIGRKASTRTTPTFAPVALETIGSFKSSSLFLTGLHPKAGALWSGELTRRRYVCPIANPSTLPSAVKADSDDFAYNLGNGGGASGGALGYGSRAFSTVSISAGSGTGASNGNFRLNGCKSSTTATGCANNLPVTSPVTASFSTGAQLALGDMNSIIAGVDDQDMGLTGPYNFGTFTTTSTQARTIGIGYNLGASSSLYSSYVPAYALKQRGTELLGDIIHATPIIIGAPNANIRDEGYTAFRQTFKKRPAVLYAPTNDGQLHAFYAGVTADGSAHMNEMWSFMPPAVLPLLPTLFKQGHTNILDGAPVVRDTVHDRAPTLGEMVDGSKWHTTLVASFGSGGPGYYALDITDPRRPDETDTSPDGVAMGAGDGPKFLWQLTNISKGGTNIFGTTGVTPAITTVLIKPNSASTAAREIGVAILPGGISGGPIGAVGCDRIGTHDPGVNFAVPESGYTTRTKVRCWNPSGRSVSVVRLDTGEVIATFGRASEIPPSNAVGGYWGIDTPLDSPMIGVPAVYPGQIGTTAQKVYLGDADGTIWRFDLTANDPALWKGELFFDTVNTTVDNSATAWQKGNPIALSPVLAVDKRGNVVIEVATGDQDSYTAAGTNYLYSITDKLSSSAPYKVRANVNWWLPFTDGERVSGPMAVFNSVLYFTTFKPSPLGTSSCQPGSPRIWGRDFVVPKSATLSEGGALRFNPAGDPTPPLFYDPVAVDPTYAGKLLPGVSINITPTCADDPSPETDQYAPGSQHYVVKNVTPGQPRLLVPVPGAGAGGTSVGAASYNVNDYAAPSAIDAWASVVE